MTSNFRVFQEIDKVIDINSKGERGGRNVSGRVIGINDAVREQAWVRRVVLGAKAIEDRHDLVVPVVWAPAKTIKCLLEKPIFVFVSVGVTDGWFHDCDFAVGENALTKGVLEVFLLEGAAMFNREADNELHCIGAKDRGILV